MISQPVPLSESLTTFCDTVAWSDYLACFTDKAQALTALSQGSRGYFQAYAFDELAARPHDLNAVRKAKSFEIGDRLVNELKHKLTKGILAIAGFHMQSSEVRSIPAPLCAALVLSFIDDTATLHDVRYSIVTVRHALTTKTVDASDLCEAWLRERRAQHGDEKRAVLAVLAREHFGSITDVAFGAAYTRVYGRKRGKPRKVKI